MLQRDDSLASLVRRAVGVISSKKRKFTANQEDAGGGAEFNWRIPPIRRESVKYWANFTKEPPCAEVLGDDGETF